MLVLKLKFLLFHFSMLVILVSCADTAARKTNFEPPLTKSQMIAILSEKALIEAALKDAPNFDSIRFSISFRKSALDSSLLYYAERPGAFKDLYMEVLVALQQRESQLFNSTAK